METWRRKNTRFFSLIQLAKMKLLLAEIKGTVARDFKPIVANTSHTSAPESVTTVASFRTWRGSQLIVAKGPMFAIIGSYSRRERDSNPRYAMNVYTLSRRAPSAARTSLPTAGVRLNQNDKMCKWSFKLGEKFLLYVFRGYILYFSGFRCFLLFFVY